MLFIILPTHNERKEVIEKMIWATHKEFPVARVLHVDDSNGRGKGWAVRQGFIRAFMESRKRTDLFAYIDGDGDIDPSELKKLIKEIVKYDVVVGKKDHQGLVLRRIITYLSRIYIRILFGLNVDTQTGIKLYRKKAAFLVEEDNFLFDILMLQKANKFFNISEVPVTARIVKNVSPRILLRTLLESVRIFFSPKN